MASEKLLLLLQSESVEEIDAVLKMNEGSKEVRLGPLASSTEREAATPTAQSDTSSVL